MVLLGIVAGWIAFGMFGLFLFGDNHNKRKETAGLIIVIAMLLLPFTVYFAPITYP